LRGYHDQQAEQQGMQRPYFHVGSMDDISRNCQRSYGNPSFPRDRLSEKCYGYAAGLSNILSRLS
jgi:hypothetical protein